ncbi:FAD-dependent oxidoreductase [Paenibacillus donghaensis]|uniref:FAD-dependent oxidoreductase n=1 Tax=Paenibacillus donghaensis TaxID=414771 RepID=UPI00188437C3|nr:FAD-dependent oxidoreductase [Paenibacillus donghaensis]MBE9915294.1 FAD-dependent oxidoreductase [Paenibacillus donghaensis]
MNKKVIIVGGVAGGASAAARLRRLDEEAEIILLERGEHISFANCGLPYYIGGTIQDRSKLLVQTPEMMERRFRIDVRVQNEAIQVNTKDKTVTIRQNGDTYEENYDALILSPGAKPIRPSIEGIDHSRILSLRNISDTDHIKSMVDMNAVREVTVIGGGFIGVEMAEVLAERGLKVTLVESAPHILAPFDDDVVPIVEKELQDHGVRLILGDPVMKFNDVSGNGPEVILQSGHSHHADLVIMAIGVTPDTAFLKDSGIELGPKGHIIVNEYLQTNCEDVYAVGDAIEIPNFVTGQKTAVPLAGPANKQGRIAADHIAGLPSKYEGAQGTSILKVFRLTAASTGSNERTLRRRGIPYRTALVHPGSHAGYYPGAEPMTLKLIYDKQGRVLGAQALGGAGVDKRMDVLATVIRLKGTVQDLTELELAYAPPYSSAKDPVNMAGFVAQNDLNGMSPTITLEDIKERNKENTILLDVRTRQEFEQGHIPDAVNIPLDELRDRLDQLDSSKKLLVYCQVGLRGYTAVRILRQKGFNAVNLTGGYKYYKSASFTPDQDGIIIY